MFEGKSGGGVDVDRGSNKAIVVVTIVVATIVVLVVVVVVKGQFLLTTQGQPL